MLSLTQFHSNKKGKGHKRHISTLPPIVYAEFKQEAELIAGVSVFSSVTMSPLKLKFHESKVKILTTPQLFICANVLSAFYHRVFSIVTSDFTAVAAFNYF